MSNAPAASAASTDEAIAAVERQLGALFNRVRATWKDSATSVHPELQPVGYKILGTLVHSGPTSAGALAELLTTDKSVLSRQVKLMAGLGLVEVHPDPADGRARVLAATPLAVERVTAVRASQQARLNGLLRTWPDDDIRTFADLLGRLTP